MREDRIAIAILAMLVVIAFANVVFGGKSLVPSESIDPLDHRMRGPDALPLETWTRRGLYVYPNFRDVAASVAQFEPSREFLRRSLLRGELPLWDPYLGGGVPSFASLLPAYLFPPSLLVVLLGNGSLVRNLYILALIFCSGTLLYFLLRRHELRWQAALAGSIAFMFSGAVIQTAPSHLGQPVAFFALPLIVTARLVDMPGARRAAQLALAFAFVALATFPPILMQIFGMAVVYVAVALSLKPRAITAAWFAAGSATGMLMVGVAYLPAAKLMAELDHVRDYYSDAAQAILPLHQIGQLLSPTIAGGAAVYARLPISSQYPRHLFYTGVVALFLAGVGLMARTQIRARALKLSAAICAVLALAKIFGIPPVQWIDRLPLLRSIHYATYFGILVAFCVAVLAAIGIDALLDGRARKWHIVTSGALLALALVIVRVAAAHKGVQLQPEGWRWIADFRLLVLFGALAVIFAWRPVMLVIAVLAIEGITNSVYPRPYRWEIWDHPPRYLEILNQRNSGNRVLPMPIYPANTESIYRQPTIDTILLPSTRMRRLYERYFLPRIHEIFLRDTRQIPPERILDAANIEYLAIQTIHDRDVAEAARRGYETLYADPLVHLMRRPTVPRYTFTSNYRVTRSPREALNALATLPRDTVLLEESPSFAPAASVADVRTMKFALNEAVIAVDALRAGLLVCSESNMSGWTATIDGKPTRILAANYAFRAVEVPPGAHTIRLAYSPPGLKAGLIATILGCIICAWGLRRAP